MAWMETDYSKHTYFQWKVKGRLEHLDVLGTMGETTPLSYFITVRITFTSTPKVLTLPLFHLEICVLYSILCCLSPNPFTAKSEFD